MNPFVPGFFRDGIDQDFRDRGSGVVYLLHHLVAKFATDSEDSAIHSSLHDHVFNIFFGDRNGLNVRILAVSCLDETGDFRVNVFARRDNEYLILHVLPLFIQLL